MQCDTCGADLPDDPRDAVENDRLDEVVAHIYDPEEESFVLSETAYFCDLTCAAEATLLTEPEEVTEASKATLMRHNNGLVFFLGEYAPEMEYEVFDEGGTIQTRTCERIAVFDLATRMTKETFQEKVTGGRNIQTVLADRFGIPVDGGDA